MPARVASVGLATIVPRVLRFRPDVERPEADPVQPLEVGTPPKIARYAARSAAGRPARGPADGVSGEQRLPGRVADGLAPGAGTPAGGDCVSASPGGAETQSAGAGHLASAASSTAGAADRGGAR